MDYVGYAQEQALAYGVPVGFFTSLIRTESHFDPNAYNPSSGASGIGQFLPSTAQQPGYGIMPFNPFDPQAALKASAQYLRALHDQLGSWSQAALGYLKGPGYAAQHPGEASYSEASGVPSELRNLGELLGTGGGNTVSTAGTTDTSQPDASGCSGWLSTPIACGSELLTRAGYIILGLIVIALGIWFLSK